MTRSVWKGPFVDGYLLKKADTALSSGRKDVIKTWSRRSTIMPQFVGLTFGVYNGHKHVRRLSPVEAKARVSTIRTGFRKLNVVAQSIRGLRVQKALNELEFSPKR